MSIAILFGSLLFTSCSNTDNGVVLPEEEEPLVRIPLDFTDLVKTDAASWSGSGTYAVNVTTADGRNVVMAEHYYSGFPCDDYPLKQDIEGLEDGKYTVVVAATSNLAWIESDVEAGAEDVAFVYATSGNMKAIQPIPVGRETGFTTPGIYSMDVDVVDGKMEVGLGLANNSKTNWHTIQIMSLTQWKEVTLSEAYEQLSIAVSLVAASEVSEDLKAAILAAAAAPQTVENYEALIQILQTVQDDPVYKAYHALKDISDSSLENWTCTNSAAFHINTWSGEGNSDGTDMKTPFIENWMNKNDGTLPKSEITYEMKNLLPGDAFKVSALVRIYSEAGNEIQGASFFAGSEKFDIAEYGTPFVYGDNRGVYTRVENVLVRVGEDGVLKFGVAIEEGATFNWVAIKDVKVEKVEVWI